MSNFIVPPSIFTDGVDVSGTGFLAGEFPGGRTTINGVPTSASVKAFYVLESGDWQLAGQATSNPDGTWLIGGINHDLRFNVVGQVDGYNDVVMANIKPMRTDMITYDDAYLQPNEDFKGMEGYILLLDGLLPLTVSGTQSMPAGLFTVVDGRKLLIDGTTSEGGEWEAEITIQDANSNTVNIPVVIPIGLDAPSSLAATYDEAENQITLDWVSNSHVEQAFYIYRSDSPLDLGDLPPPIGSVGKGVTEFVDGTVVYEETYYYAVAAVRGSSIRAGETIVAYAGADKPDPHWGNVVALLHFDDPNDVVKTEKGANWYIHKTGSGFGEVTQNAAKFGVAGLKLNSPSSANYYYPFTDGVILTGEIFTAEVFCMPRKPSSQIFTSFFNIGDGDQVLTFNANGEVWFYRGRNALGGALNSVGVNQYTLNTYYHIAMTFDGTHIRVFVDGNKEIEIATALGWTGYSNTRFGLGDTDIGGYNSSYRQATDVYFDELRITKGVARYTENFTPPIAPFPNF